MGFNLYIKARIIEKDSRRIITQKDCEDFWDDGFFKVCEWIGRDFSCIRDAIIEIANRYAGTKYSSEDNIIPLKQSALREIYGFIVKNSFVSDDVQFGNTDDENYWEDRGNYERMNVENARKLCMTLQFLDCIEHLNILYGEYEDLIKEKKDLENFSDNPQAYYWEFQIFNSY